MIIRVADRTDNEKLVKLAKLTPMQGTISICIEREPDFFSLLNKKGEPHVIVAEEDDIIVGCVSIVKEEMILLNQPTNFNYLCDLKVHPGYRRMKIATKLCKAMHDHLLHTGSDFLFSTFANGNKKVQPIMEGKAGISEVHSAGTFYIIQLVPQKNIKQQSAYQIHQFSDEEKVLEMHRNFSSKYVLHPAINAKTYTNCFHYAAFKNGEPVAIISLFDAGDLKQNVLVDIPWYFSIAVNFLRLAKPLLNTPYMPHKGEKIKILYVKSYSYLAGHEEAFLSLLSFSNRYAYINNYSFLSITFHETDRLRRRIRGFKAFPFKAHGMICSLKNNHHIIKKIAGGNILEDFSLI